jgi:hypothetical protein
MTGEVSCLIPAGQSRSAVVDPALPAGVTNIWAQAQNPGWYVAFCRVNNVLHLGVFRVGPVADKDETCLVHWLADVQDAAS